MTLWRIATCVATIALSWFASSARAGEFDAYSRNLKPQIYEGIYLTGPRTQVAIRPGADCDLMCYFVVKFRLRGRPVPIRSDTDDADSPYTVAWTCARHGLWSWEAFYPEADQETSASSYSDEGSFRIRRCRARRRRTVGRGTVAARAASFYDGEFVSSSRCHPLDVRRSRWRCAVTHNNTYRQCVDTDEYDYYSTDRFGFPWRSYEMKGGPTRCEFF